MSTGTPSPDSNSGDRCDDDDDLQLATMRIFEELIDEVTLGLCFEVHKQNKSGTLFLAESDPEAMKQFEIVDQLGLDVFGQVPMKKQLECICPNCSRNLAASRFAPHLEKCMGMGRNSSRIASRRIANAGSKKDSDNDSEVDDDYEWTSSRATNKRRKDRMVVGRPRKIARYKNLVERKSLLHQTCGVISEHTKRMCTRSFKCPQHSDEQRRAVRVLLSGGTGLPSGGADGDDHVDIDGYDDTENQALRDSLQWEANSNPSPADSSSTTNSSGGSKKRPKKHR